MAHEELMKTVKDFAKEVYATLGAGYDENIYEEALAVELRRAKIPFDVQLNTEVLYKGEKVGLHRLDFILDRKLVIELKAGASFTGSHRKQLTSYLRSLGLDTGLLINFAYPPKEEPDFEEVFI